MRLKDKIAIVTGAGSGFGEGIAKRFAEEGCKVLVNDINVEGGQRVAKEIIAAGGKAAFYVGALGSRSNTAKRKKRLTEFDLSQAELDRLHGPVGLRIGSKTPPEIAVAILAEMTAVRHGVDLPTVGIKESKEVEQEGPVCSATARA